MRYDRFRGSRPTQQLGAEARRELTIRLVGQLRSTLDTLEELMVLAVDSDHLPEEPSAPPPQAAPKLPPEKLMYTIKDVATLIGISKSTLYAAMSEGKLAAIKAGNRTLITAAELRRWTDSFPARHAHRYSRRHGGRT